jgi:hypothetical protein
MRIRSSQAYIGTRNRRSVALSDGSGNSCGLCGRLLHARRNLRTRYLRRIEKRDEQQTIHNTRTIDRF